MIITQEMIDTVREYAGTPEDSVDMTSLQTSIRKFIHDGWEVQFKVWDKAPYIQLCTANILVNLYDYATNTFPLKVWFRGGDPELTVGKLLLGAKDAELIAGNEQWFKDRISHTDLPELRKFMERREVCIKAHAYFDTFEKLYDRHGEEGKLDLDRTLTHLWKQPKEVWSLSIYACWDGKAHSFKRIREFSTEFYKTYQSILALQEKEKQIA